VRLFNLFPFPKTPIRDVLISYTKINRLCISKCVSLLYESLGAYKYTGLENSDVLALTLAVRILTTGLERTVVQLAASQVELCGPRPHC
jgi:hypothetical protein